MTVRFQPAEWLHRLQTSRWLVPATMVVGSACIAVFLVQLHDPVSARAIDNWPAVFGAGAEVSRAMLTAIAGSMITVAGVVFSITLVTLSLASTQYSPRVLRNFLADRATRRQAQDDAAVTVRLPQRATRDAARPLARDRKGDAPSCPARWTL